MSVDPFDAIIGRSRAAEAMRAFGRRAAAVDAPVLLLGESGTGKGILARAIHLASRRGGRPIISVNCAAIPESLFESEFFGHVRGGQNPEIALQRAGGRIYGPKGAAELLGVKPTTLQSRLRALGIRTPDNEARR